MIKRYIDSVSNSDPHFFSTPHSGKKSNIDIKKRPKIPLAGPLRGRGHLS